jgi:hypothetical protein
MKSKKTNETNTETLIHDISAYPRRDIFYHLKNNTLANIRDIILWARNNGFRTDVTMLDVFVSMGRIKSDKDFDTVFGLINVKSKPFFVMILRKKMNLYGYLYDEAVTGDLLEIGIRNINADRKEYFIITFLKPEMLDELKSRHELIEAT